MGSPAVRVERVFDSEDTTDVCRIATDGARATLAWRTDASLKLSPASLRALAGMLVEAADEVEGKVRS